MGSRTPLHVVIRPVSSLSPSEVEEMYALFERYYDGADRGRFERDLRQKQDVILLQPKAGGPLGGFSTLRVLAPGEALDNCRVLYSGDTVVDRAHWGQKALQRGFVQYLLTLRFRDLKTPLYWLLTTKGYRTYLLLTNYFPQAWPRWDRRIPDPVLALRNTLGRRRYGDRFDPQTGLLKLGADLDHLRPGVADITPNDLQNPDIRFFAAANPNWRAGDELLCLARIRRRDPLLIVAKLARRQVKAWLD